MELASERTLVGEVLCGVFWVPERSEPSVLAHNSAVDVMSGSRSYCVFHYVF